MEFNRNSYLFEKVYLEIHVYPTKMIVLALLIFLELFYVLKQNKTKPTNSRREIITQVPIGEQCRKQI